MRVDMIQHVPVGLGGTVETEFIGGRPASCTVSIIDRNTDVRVASTAAVVDTVNTTLTAAAAQDALTVTLASATGLATDGRRYLLDGEEVGVKSVSGFVATLWSPLERAHDIGATFTCPRVTYVIQAAVCDEEWWDGQAVFVPAGGGLPQVEVISCAQHPIPIYLFGMADCRVILPKAMGAVSAELDIPRSIRAARDNILLLLGTKARATTHLGVDHMRLLGAHQWWLDRRIEFGDMWRPEMEQIEADRDRIRDLIMGQAPRGEADGGAIPGPGGAIFPRINLGAM